MRVAGGETAVRRTVKRVLRRTVKRVFQSSKPELMAMAMAVGRKRRNRRCSSAGGRGGRSQRMWSPARRGQ